MILALIVVVPLLGACAAWAASRRSSALPRWIVLAALVVDLGLVLAAAIGRDGGRWWASADWPWFPRFGIRIHLALDGLSFVLVLLTLFVGALAVAGSWSEIRGRVGFFHFNLACSLSGILGVFLALDLFLFYFFWELMLVPMYLLIAIWGHAHRTRAAFKFFLFTQAGGLLMLVAIVALAMAHHAATGLWSYDYEDLLGMATSGGAATWVMLGFFAAFAVKLPVLPVHSWLPDAHTEAPTGGSIVLAGLLLKTGAYGLLRFVLPLFAAASHQFAPLAMSLGVAGILYGAVLAYGQTDLKRLVAYTSVSHMGFVLLGIYAGNPLALAGAMMQIVAHGLSTGGLFFVVGALAERCGTRELDRLGGLWSAAPRMGGFVTVLAMASLGLPGLANFVGEFLILAGTFRVHPLLAGLAATGLVLAAAYSLRMLQRVFQGPPQPQFERTRDLGPREVLALTTIVLALVWLAVWPQPVLDAAPTLPRASIVEQAP